MGRPIATTTHGGYTLLLPHNPFYTWAVVGRAWGAVWEGPAFAAWSIGLEAELARENPPLDKSHLCPRVELARDAWMNRRARRYMAAEPLMAVKAGLTLLGRFWNIVPLTTKERNLPPPLRVAIGIYYSVLFGALVVGMVRVLRTTGRAWWPLLVL